MNARTTWLLLMLALLTGPRGARAYEAVVVASGMVTETCDGSTPREVPFTVSLHVPRASWPDATGFNWDVASESYTSGVPRS